MPDKYKDDDYLTLRQVSEVLGYTYGHMASMFAPGNSHYDPSLRQIRIRTDETFRRAYRTKAQYVFRYGDVKRWFNEHQELPAVQAYNESRGIIVE